MAAPMNRLVLYVSRCVYIRLVRQTQSFSLYHGNKLKKWGDYNNKLLNDPQCQLYTIHAQSNRLLSASPLWHFKKKEKAEPPVQPSQKQDNVLVFNSTGTLVGKMSLSRAEGMARKDNLKLVDSGVNQDKIQCYKLLTGKEYFEVSMKLKSQKITEKSKEEKEFRVSAKISDHDLSIKLNQIRESLKKGKNVKISVRRAKKVAESEIDRLQSAVLKNISEKVQDIAIVKRATRTTSDLTFVLIPQDNEEESSQA